MREESYSTRAESPRGLEKVGLAAKGTRNDSGQIAEEPFRWGVDEAQVAQRP